MTAICLISKYAVPVVPFQFYPEYALFHFWSLPFGNELTVRIYWYMSRPISTSDRLCLFWSHCYFIISRTRRTSSSTVNKPSVMAHRYTCASPLFCVGWVVESTALFFALPPLSSVSKSSRVRGSMFFQTNTWLETAGKGQTRPDTSGSKTVGDVNPVRHSVNGSENIASNVSNSTVWLGRHIKWFRKVKRKEKGWL